MVTKSEVDNSNKKSNISNFKPNHQNHCNDRHDGYKLFKKKKFLLACPNLHKHNFKIGSSRIKQIISYTFTMKQLKIYVETNYDFLVFEMIEKMQHITMTELTAVTNADGTMTHAEKIKFTKSATITLAMFTRFRRKLSKSMHYSMAKWMTTSNHVSRKTLIGMMFTKTRN